MITSWPRVTVLVSVLVCGAFTGGMALWYQELDQEVLWTPYNSPVRSYQAFPLHFEQIFTSQLIVFSLLSKRSG